ncbi:MAG: UrcA family protein [Gammaproteobacteria bacterium]|nr:UrcA family protein [Gammaproteobacteria bacterium]
MKGFIAVGLAAGLLLGGIAAVQSQELEEVVVEAHHMVTSKQVGRTSSGIPIVEMSVSYRVSTEGLDLSKHADMQRMEKRIKDAARSACKDIAREWPFESHDEAQCAGEAAHKPLEQVHAMAHEGSESSD